MSERFNWDTYFQTLGSVPTFATSKTIQKLNEFLLNKSPPRTADEVIKLHQQLTTYVLNSHQSQRLQSGDVQTRPHLAKYSTKLVFNNCRTNTPVSVIDPTCGTGIFLLTTILFATDNNIKLTKLAGIERKGDSALVSWFMASIMMEVTGLETELEIFNLDLLDITMIENFPSYDILIGNPPWITWTDLPKQDKNKWKTINEDDFSFVNVKGMDKAMGAVNIDISVAMMLLSFQKIANNGAFFGFLLKENILNTQTAKYLRMGQIPHVNGRSLNLLQYSKIRSQYNFHTADTLYTDFVIGKVDSKNDGSLEMIEVEWSDQQWKEINHQFLFLQQIPDDIIYRGDDRDLVLDDRDTVEIRHGVKHDCTDVYNIDEEIAKSLDWECVYPTVKSRHIKSDGWTGSFSYVIVPETSLTDISEDEFESTYPQTYRYLLDHKDRLTQRKSRWLKNRNFYSIFGIGEYSFAKYKVAWVRLGWKPIFVLLEPVELPSGEVLPIIPSDHFMFIPVHDRSYGQYLVNLLNSSAYQHTLDTLSSKTKSSLPKRIVSKLSIPTYDEYVKKVQNIP